jgi:transposase InsO family protein
MIDRSISRQYRWKVKGRLAVLEYANAHGIQPAATRFGLDRKTIREWRDRTREAGPVGLVPRYPKRRARRIPAAVVDLIAQARRDLQYGACRTRIWLLRVHEVKVATKTITRICDDLGLPPVQRPKRRRAGRQLKLFEKATPGESVQVDVKVVKLGTTKAYQYTACDDCTRLRVLRLYRRQDTLTSLDFVNEIVTAFPFPIQKVQTDNGSEFSFTFLLAVERRGIRHRYIKPRRPDQNGKVERSHRVDAEEFWGRHTFASFEAAAGALPGWEREYNEVRFSMALQGRTPAEKLAAVLGAAA